MTTSCAFSGENSRTWSRDTDDFTRENTPAPPMRSGSEQSWERSELDTGKCNARSDKRQTRSVSTGEAYTEPSRRWMRCSIGGCVLKSAVIPRPENGFMMNMWAVAGFAFIGTRRTPDSIFRKASASPYGLPTIWAAPRSAANSRDREMAAWISMADTGARMIVAISAIGFELPRLSRPPKPPKIAANWAILATIVIVAATVAATELMRMSRCFTCDSSCAMTPSNLVCFP